ncbi:MAG TPA: PDZ domain-containing protein [Vicinamibacterales bacterium]|nr:PDZ domain-containing protein [Vicinamibacterales bacterium]
MFRNFTILLLLAAATPAVAQVDARMFREPAVSADKIAFVYAGDIWLVPKAGGTAVRLSSPLGEESFPRFSPDGSKLAYSADYDGNTDVYVVPTAGGTPVRLTHHPMADRVVGWHPDGKRVLFASGRESGRQRYNQFYLVGVDGGMPEKLPIPYGEFGAFSSDGARFAYMPMSQDFRNWKRYRGGWAPDIWVFDLKTMAARNITNNPANDAQPMWFRNTIYFISDRGSEQRNNIWAEDLGTGAVRQVTQYNDFDITFPSIGPDSIVFQKGGRIYLLSLPGEKVTEVPIKVVTDESTLRATTKKADKEINYASVSPTGKRVAFEARGDVVTLPAEHGAAINVTRSSGVADRFPRWSPDGKTLAYWSDRSGEYELTLRPADGAGTERKVTALGAGFRYPPHWSPDNKKIAFVDQAMRIHVYDDGTGKVTDIDKSPDWIADGALQAFRFRWSPDSRWIAYARPAGTSNNAIFLYDTKSSKLTQVTSGYLNDTTPAFDPEGKYLFYASDRAFDPVYGSFDTSWTYANPTRIVAVPLRKDVKSPLAARNDAENPALDTDKKEHEASDQKEREASAERKTDDKKAPAPVDIDLEGFETRAVVLPPKSGSYPDLEAVKGKLIYRRTPRAGTHDEQSPIVYFDFEEREEKTILDDADAMELTFDGKKLLVTSGKDPSNVKYAIVDVKEKQKFEKPIDTAAIEGPVDPRGEWKQIFMDTFRFERDFFYDPGMHGVNWNGMKERYATLLDDAVTRWDVDWIIGEFLGELNASHTYHGGGDMEQGPSRSIGMLGVDWEPANGAYRIKKIIRGGPWDTRVRSPLDEPGVDVKEGEYVLAVNGRPLDVKADPWAAFEDLGQKTVVLTVNGSPSTEGSRQVVVTCLNSEIELRFRAWIEERRQIVDKATNGRAGYIYVQSTGTDAQNELMRQFMAQWKKEGLVIDERWNSGGQIPDRFIELLNRPILSYWAVRDAPAQQWPPVAARGPKVMLINGWSGSGGDAFPFYFREAGLGPLIGTRTWGGLIGISGAPQLVDGGSVTVPTFRMYDPKGTWFAEGHGVDPDIAVEDDPSQIAKGVDPQLQRAIDEINKRIAAAPKAPAQPAYEKRTPGSER